MPVCLSPAVFPKGAIKCNSRITWSEMFYFVSSSNALFFFFESWTVPMNSLFSCWTTLFMGPTCFPPIPPVIFEDFPFLWYKIALQTLLLIHQVCWIRQGLKIEMRVHVIKDHIIVHTGTRGQIKIAVSLNSGISNFQVVDFAYLTTRRECDCCYSPWCPLTEVKGKVGFL